MRIFNAEERRTTRSLWICESGENHSLVPISLSVLLRETPEGAETCYLALFPQGKCLMLPCTAFRFRPCPRGFAHALLQNIKLPTY